MISRTSLRAGLAAAAALLALAAGQAQAGCQLSIEPGSDQWLIPFDPFTQDVATRQFDVALVNRGDSVCGGNVRVDLRGEQFGLTQSGQDDRMIYALVDETSGADVTPRAGQSARRFNARPVRLAPGERSLIRFDFVASPGDTPARGVYSQTAFLSVRDGDDMSLAERPVTLAVNVASAAVMGLKGEFQRQRGTATIDLGELVEGPKPLSTSLYVLSTGGYRVSVSSANQGRLRLGASEWYVAYDLAVGGDRMNLGASDSFEVVSRHARADSYPLAVRIGDVDGKRAGKYSDVLTFTIAAI